MTNLETFRLLATEFNMVSDSVVNAYMDLSKPLVSLTRFGELYPQALSYITAHRMKMAGLGDSLMGISGLKAGESVGLSSVSEGETSVSFSNNQAVNIGVDGEYSMTQYGIMFLTLRRLVSVNIVSAGECDGL